LTRRRIWAMANSLNKLAWAIFLRVSNRVCSPADKEIEFAAAISISLRR